MIRCLAMLAAVVLTASAPAHAWDLKVGPGLYYTMPSQAVKDAKDGDRVLIQAGTYENDTATWSAITTARVSAWKAVG
jgi:hypothetical protein